jgi:hypothetical protein
MDSTPVLMLWLETLVRKGDRLLCRRAVEALAFSARGICMEMTVAFKKSALRSRIRAALGA